MSGGGKILVTGGSGLLGGELKKRLPGALFPSHGEFDVEDPSVMAGYLEGKDVAQVLHAAAFTSPPKINEDPARAIAANVIGTANVARLCLERGIRLVYVSTDYVFDGSKGNYSETDPVLPVNKYAWSKLGGECAAMLLDDSMVIRTSFGENEFPYPKAFVDQWTSRESVSQIADKIAMLLEKTEYKGILHVGGPRRSVFEYAESVANGKEIGELSVNDVNFDVPVDTSFDVAALRGLIGIE